MNINEHILCITNLGEFESLPSVWEAYPEGGKEGDYIYLGEDLYYWDKYSRSWVIGVDVDSSQIRPINVTYAEGVIDYSEGYINCIGSFDGFEQVWEAYPEGGKDGDYILVAGERYKWNKYISNWGEIDSSEVVPARPIATVWGDLHVHNDAVIGEDLYARILETFTTKKWVLEQGYIHTDDVTSDVVMSRILTDNETITKKNGRLSVIGNIGGGGVADSVAWSNITGKPLWIGDEKPKYTLSEIIGDSGDGLVTIKGDQSIEGIKDFVFGAKFGGALLRYDSSKKCWIFPNNVLVEGGIAWNSRLKDFTEEEIFTITSAVKVDWNTIGKNENGELYVIGGTSGGGGDVVGGVTLDEVKNYLTSEKYATQGWVAEQGYLKSISASMVTSALNYTPFNSADFTKDKIKSTLGISDWALASSLQWSAINGRPTKLSDLDDDLVTGNYLPIKGIAEGAKTLKGAETNSSWVVAGGAGINIRNNNATQRCWFGYSLPEGSPYATTKWVFGASDSSGKASGEIYAKHISLGYGDSTTTGGYALRANGDAKIDGSLTLNGKVISYNASNNAFILPANVIIEGGVAWNSKLDGFDVPTIMDAVIVDGETIIKENGKLKVVGDVSGGINESQLGDYLTRNNYAKKSDIPSLSGYATESFVTSRGYITSAAISKANIKSILGISDWALAATSPLVNHGKVTSTTDLTALTTGLGYTQGYTPVEGAYEYGQIINFNGTRGHTQIYISDDVSNGGAIFFRTDWEKTKLADRVWREILSAKTYTKYAMSLATDQDVTGVKNFVNGFKVGGNLITYDASLKAFVLNGNLIVKGGFAWEKDN